MKAKHHGQAERVQMGDKATKQGSHGLPHNVYTCK
jgi:hypothetical protein